MSAASGSSGTVSAIGDAPIAVARPPEEMLSTVESVRVPVETLKGRVIRASAWTIALQVFSAIIRMGSNLWLAHLLLPQHFGTMALVQAMISGLSMFADVGLVQNIVQSKRGNDPAFYNTAWTFQVVRGVATWIGVCLLAWPAAWYFKVPELRYFLPVAGVQAIIYGFSSTAMITLHRNLEARTYSLAVFSQLVVQVVVMAVWASFDQSVWALVAGTIAAQIYRTILSHFLVPEVRNSFRWDPSAVHEMLGLGRWIFVSTALTFLGTQLDKFLIGRLVGVGHLGVYSSAQSVAMVPRDFGASLLNQVLYPVLAEKARQGIEPLKNALVKARRVVLPFTMFCLLGVGITSNLFFGYLYKPEFHDAGWMAQLLCLGVWFAVLKLSVDRAILALGDSRTPAISESCKLAALVAFSLVGHRFLGMKGFILGVVAGALAGHVVVLVRLQRFGLNVWPQDIKYTLTMLALGTLGAIGPRIINPRIPGSTPATESLLTLGFAVLILTVTGLWVLKRFRTDVFNRGRHATGSISAVPAPITPIDTGA